MITQERLKELFNLDPETGVMYWNVRPGSRGGPKIGDVAGCLSRGYWRIKIGTKLYQRSHLVFLFYTGIAAKQLDHRNRIKIDDRPDNLRTATTTENARNAIWSKASCLPKGVTWRDRLNPFRADIQVNGCPIYLGSFPAAELAHAAYCAAAERHFGEFARFA